MKSVAVGPATVVGYVLSALTAGAAVLAAAEHELAGPGKWLAIISAVSAVATNLGRQLQAATAPAPQETLAARPESAVKPDPV